MDSADDLECALDILRAAVCRMEQDIKTIGDELHRVKKQLVETNRAMKLVKLAVGQQTRH